jgi:hypothetical protein
MFYTYDQNNSGGYFIENDDVREYLIIEADSVSEANDKMYDITEDYSEFCECCGERWDEFWGEEGKDEPMIYSTPVNEVEKGMFRNSCIIYYKNGDKKIVEFKEKFE